MIKANELTSVGQFYKPHGIKGEINASLDESLTPDDLRCLIVDVDGIYVPFFVESWRGKGADFLIKVKGVDDEQLASDLVNKEIFALTKELPAELANPEDGVYLSDLVGFDVVVNNERIGRITDIDDSTVNILLNVERDNGKVVFIPFVEEFIVRLDPGECIIEMELPEGLLELND